MKVYRVEKNEYLNVTLTGIGASKTNANRWNSHYTRLVYTAESRALVILEVAVHLDINEDLPADRYYVEIDIPDDIVMQEVAGGDLPANWDAKPPMAITQFIGDEFVNQNKAAVLKVPSSIVPQEFDYLINPMHEDAQKIKVTDTTPMRFDERLFFSSPSDL
jgi:RES domain-containing protein